METGEYEVATGTLKAAQEAADELGLTALAARARLRALYIGYVVAAGDVGTPPEAAVRADIELFERLGDEAGLAEAWRFIMQLRLVEGQWAKVAEAVALVIEHAERAGDALMVSRMSASRPAPRSWARPRHPKSSP